MCLFCFLPPSSPRGRKNFFTGKCFASDKAETWKCFFFILIYRKNMSDQWTVAHNRVQKCLYIKTKSRNWARTFFFSLGSTFLSPDHNKSKKLHLERLASRTYVWGKRKVSAAASEKFRCFIVFGASVCWQHTKESPPRRLSFTFPFFFSIRPTFFDEWRRRIRVIGN